MIRSLNWPVRNSDDRFRHRRAASSNDVRSALLFIWATSLRVEEYFFKKVSEENFIQILPFSVVTNLGADPDRAKDVIVGVVLTMGQCIQETLVDDVRLISCSYHTFRPFLQHTWQCLQIIKKTNWQRHTSTLIDEATSPFLLEKNQISNIRAGRIPVSSSNSKSTTMRQLHSSCWRKPRLRMDWFVIV